VILRERSMRTGRHGPPPTWWLLYLIAALFVALVGLEEILVDGEGLRKVLEVLTVVGGFGLFAVWRRTNRIALDLGRRLR
jgi:hypothetical protein